MCQENEEEEENENSAIRRETAEGKIYVAFGFKSVNID